MGKAKSSWEEDGSLDVLLEWLRTPGNYEIWSRGNRVARGKVLRNVLAELEKGGIRRSEGSIRAKLRHLEAKCESAVAWLKKTGVKDEDELRGAVGTDVETKLQQICPHYLDLMPVFGALGFGAKRVPERKRRASDERQETTKKRRTELSMSEARPAQQPKTTGLQSPVGGKRHSAASVDVFSRGFSGATNWYEEKVVVLQAPFKFKPSAKFCENLEKEQLNLTRELNKGVVKTDKKRHDLELEARKEREKLALAEQVVVARHNLKKMGVSADEIQLAIPLPHP